MKIFACNEGEGTHSAAVHPGNKVKCLIGLTYCTRIISNRCRSQHLDWVDSKDSSACLVEKEEMFLNSYLPLNGESNAHQ